MRRWRLTRPGETLLTKCVRLAMPTVVARQPLTSGDIITTSNGARAEIQIGAMTLRLDSSSRIEFDRIGRRVAYHFLRRHPGDSTDPGLAGEIVRVPAAEVIHVIDPVEGGQLRGVSKLAPAIVKLFLLDQYDDAELDRKKVAAMYAMFVTSPAPENPLAPPEDEDGPAGGRGAVAMPSRWRGNSLLCHLVCRVLRGSVGASRRRPPGGFGRPRRADGPAGAGWRVGRHLRPAGRH